MSVLEVNNLTKDYGSGRGVFDVSFKVNEGEVFGFLGPNGAGKSTTIRHLMGFSHPDKGNTKILGKDSFKEYSSILSNVGYIPGEIALPAGLNGYEFIRMMQDMYHVHNNDMLAKMLDLFELKDNVLRGDTKHMSLGVKRKLAIVTAFMSDPQVLILDEPTSGLDPVMQQKFIDFIVEEKKRGKTILLSSHIFSEVDATCDRIAIIKDGRIVSEFNADDLKHATLKQYRIVFDNHDEYQRFKDTLNTDIINIIKDREPKNKLFITCEDSNINQVVEFLSTFKIKEFNNIKETLEDYFMKFYKEDKEFGGSL
ncbi:MAG: ABC transporter ATP-binding protein [Acholeplasmatales bacterium]|nr:ABC transporter ATP-binding protein [Acholeplasmatales bacterium]